MKGFIEGRCKTDIPSLSGYARDPLSVIPLIVEISVLGPGDEFTALRSSQLQSKVWPHVYRKNHR